jgi:hypothetical protein
MQIITPEISTSEPFKINSGKQITLLATGLVTTDKVVVQLVTMTTGGPAGGECCPGQVGLPEIEWSFPLALSCNCAAPVAVELTPAKPWVVLDTPQEIYMRVVVTADDDSVVQVYKFDTNSKL